jgi:hypothetical protein
VERDGGLKTAGKSLANVFTGGLFQDALYPELRGMQREYITGLQEYKDEQEIIKKIREQEVLAGAQGRRISGLGENVIAARNTPERGDDLAAANDYLAGGGTSEGLTRIAGKMPEYQVIDNNGTPTLFDKNNPDSRGIPMLAEDGSGMHKAPDQWMIKQAGAFDRMVPRLQDLDEMERAGMTIDRGTMTRLRAYETKDAAGNMVIDALAMQKWLDYELSPEEREYILAAEDAGMVVLRDESGAAISASEILRQMNQYLMFNDYSGSTVARQRNARNRKAQTLIKDLPDYVRRDRQDLIDWVDAFDGSDLSSSAVEPAAATTGGGALPAMTQPQMTRYLELIKNGDQGTADRLVELIRLTQPQEQ